MHGLIYPRRVCLFRSRHLLRSTLAVVCFMDAPPAAPLAPVASSRPPSPFGPARVHQAHANTVDRAPGLCHAMPCCPHRGMPDRQHLAGSTSRMVHGTAHGQHVTTSRCRGTRPPSASGCQAVGIRLCRPPWGEPPPACDHHQRWPSWPPPAALAEPQAVPLSPSLSVDTPATHAFGAHMRHDKHCPSTHPRSCTAAQSCPCAARRAPPPWAARVAGSPEW